MKASETILRSLYLLSTLVFVPKVDAQQCVSGRQIRFLGCVKDMALIGYVLSHPDPISNSDPEHCLRLCFAQVNCVSANAHPIPNTQQLRCDFNSVDNITFPGTVKEKLGSYYCKFANPCEGRETCPNNKMCTPNLIWDSGICVGGVWSQWGEWMNHTCPRRRERQCANPTANKDCQGDAPKEEDSSSVVALGMESGAIPDSKITASSQGFDPKNARLNGERAWCAGSEREKWLQIQLDSPTTILKIATQSAPSDWVKVFYVDYGNSSSSEKTITTQFKTNQASNTVVNNTVSPPITGKFVKLAIGEGKCMSVEFYGCP